MSVFKNKNIPKQLFLDVCLHRPQSLIGTSKFHNNKKIFLHVWPPFWAKAHWQLVLFIKRIQLITNLLQRTSEPFMRGESGKTSEKQHLLWVQERLGREKMFDFLIICGKHDSWGKPRGLWVIGWRIELWALPLWLVYICQALDVSLRLHGSIAIFNGLWYPEEIYFLPTNLFNHIRI